jgi:hypothetical protein
VRKLIGTCGLMLLCVGAGLAQTPASPAATSPKPTAEAEQPRTQPSAVRHQPHGPGCWKQAGIAPQLVNDRWKIEDRGKTKIFAVCTDRTLSAAQRRDKIVQINSDTEKEVAQLIPSKQLAAYKACQAEKDKARPKTASAQELGPCGGIITPPDSREGMEHNH